MPLKPKARTPVWPSYTTAGCMLEGFLPHPERPVYPCLFAVLSTRAKKWIWPKVPSTKEWINKNVVHHTMEFFSYQERLWHLQEDRWNWVEMIMWSKISQAILVLIAIAVQRLHDHGSCYKGRHLIGSLHCHRFSLLSSWWDAEACSQTRCWERGWDWGRSYILIQQATENGPPHGV